MSSIGNVLKEARGKKSISLDEVYNRIKIHPRVLGLLEESKFDKLPSPLFVKSFLKSYAEFLGLNPEELVRAYEKEGEKNPEQVLFIKPVEPPKGPLLVPKGLKVLAAGVLIVSAGVYFGLSGVKFFSKPAQTNRAPKKAESSALRTPPVKKVKETIPAQAPSLWLRSPEQNNFPKISPKTPLTLQIYGDDNVWLKITCDGKVLFQSILKKGLTETWTANERIEIWTGNASNMSLRLNGVELGHVGKGVVKKMLISRQGIKNDN